MIKIIQNAQFWTALTFFVLDIVSIDFLQQITNSRQLFGISKSCLCPQPIGSRNTVPPSPNSHFLIVLCYQEHSLILKHDTEERSTDALMQLGRDQFGKLMNFLSPLQYHLLKVSIIKLNAFFFRLRGSEVDFHFYVVPDRGECQLSGTFFRIKKIVFSFSYLILKSQKYI